MDTVVIADSGTTEVISAPQDVELLVLDGTDQEVVFVGEVGLPGAKGDPGEDAHYVQDFTATASVVVTHNLGKYPAVTVFDSAGDEVEGSVDHNSINSVTVAFSAPFSGKVVCN